MESLFSFNMKFKKIQIPKEIRQKWIDALRSGDFKQTSGALRDRNKYCCLGVLCELEGIDLTRKFSEENKFVEIGSMCYPWDLRDIEDVQVPKWIRCGSAVSATHMKVALENGDHKTYNKFVTVGTFLQLLAEYNDQGRSFHDISNLIENLTTESI